MPHPSWVRGLKLKILLVDLPLFDAAPFVGAWIEITTIVSIICFVAAAPFVGAWIEM